MLKPRSPKKGTTLLSRGQPWFVPLVVFPSPVQTTKRTAMRTMMNKQAMLISRHNQQVVTALNAGVLNPGRHCGNVKYPSTKAGHDLRLLTSMIPRRSRSQSRFQCTGLSSVQLMPSQIIQERISLGDVHGPSPVEISTVIFN